MKQKTILIAILLLSSLSFAAVPAPPSGYVLINSYLNTDGVNGMCIGTDFCCPLTGYSGSCAYRVYRYTSSTDAYALLLIANVAQNSCAQSKTITDTAYCAIYGKPIITTTTPTTVPGQVTTTTFKSSTTTNVVTPTLPPGVTTSTLPGPPVTTITLPNTTTTIPGPLPPTDYIIAIVAILMFGAFFYAQK